MRRAIVMVSSVMLMAGLCGMAVAGSIDSPGAPSAGSGMPTLQQIYDYLNAGIETTPVPNFQEPLAAPGSTMKTTKEIYDTMRGIFSQGDITAENVELDKKFFCTQPGSWGIQTGKVCIAGTPTPTPTSTPTPTPSPTITPPIPLSWEGTTHTENECVALGGTVYDTRATGTICAFSGTNVAVPSGWTKAAQWQRYSPSSWGGDLCGNHMSTGPSTFSNQIVALKSPGTELEVIYGRCNGYRMDKWHEWPGNNDHDRIREINVSNPSDYTSNRIEVGCF
ncbi:MAG: hypothetical protein NTZ78_09570 [Candidatus Aureabacteria bacterium]|nr:hypothetical protein [Candidatus Auribacterota bacterium]